MKNKTIGELVRVAAESVAGLHRANAVLVERGYCAVKLAMFARAVAKVRGAK